MLGEVLAGAAEATRDAGAILAGGHTIRDAEPKYGLAVVGTVHPEGVWLKSGARPGDVVLLTARHRARPAGRARRPRAGRRARRRDCRHDRAQPGRRRHAADVHAERRHRRHRLRAPGPRPRDGGALGRAHRARRGTASALPGALELAAAGVRTGGDRRNRVRRPARLERRAGRARGARVRPADGRWLARHAPPTSGWCSRRPSPCGPPLYAIGRVEDGHGVSLR